MGRMRVPTQEEKPLRLHVLGPLQVLRAEPIELGRKSHRRLLLILALEVRRRVGTDVLIDRFWGGEPPERSNATLHMHISALRRALGSAVIVTEGSGYRFALEESDIDVSRFDELASIAGAARQSSDRDEALGLLSPISESDWLPFEATVRCNQ